MEKLVSREEQLTKAQFAMISTTGKISGEVKDILTCDDKNKMIESIDEINKNLKDLIAEVYEISKALNLDFNQIIGGSYGSENI